MNVLGSALDTVTEPEVGETPVVVGDHDGQNEQDMMGEPGRPFALQNGDAPSPKPTKPDILYCLRLYDYDNDDKPPRTIYQAETWKGFRKGLPNSEVDQFGEDTAVLGFGVEAEVFDKTGKSGNSLATWRQEPVEFELGKDAMLVEAYAPRLEIYSKRLIDVMERLMDYYPDKLGGSQDYESVLGSCFVDIMHFYAELKAYHEVYLKSVPVDDYSLRNSTQWMKISDIGDCGDGKIADRIRQRLQFGDLDITKPCDAATAYDIAVLLRFFAPMYRTRAVPTLELLLVSNDPGITYDNIWLLYKAGTLVYIMDQDKPLACVVMSATYLKKSENKDREPEERTDRTLLRLWHLCSDGTKFLRRLMPFTIPRFDGSKLVRYLEVVPCELYDRFDSGRRRAELKARGRKYLQLIKETAAYREYEGERPGHHGYIIVDPASYNQHRLDQSRDKQQTIELWLHQTSMPSSLANHVRWYLYGSGPRIEDGNGGARYHDITNIDPTNYESHRLIEYIDLLLPSTIEGFLLKTKKWMGFEVDNISDNPPVPMPNQLDNELVLLNDEDKESLRTVLPKGEKPIGLLSDFVKDKGEGKVFLLHGPPGTGKTLTVECVANDTRRPLLALTAADIGLKENSEAQLRMWFTLAAKWDAILLIDEADLFLEQRREGDVDRNSLVTVFLRTMEYYQGVLFLTTNRPGHIDDSFISRITVPIEYPALRPETKKLIVEKLVRKFQETGTILVDAKAKQHLIDNCAELNGRHLRNVLHNAVSIAEVNQRRRNQQEHTLDCVRVERHHIDSAIGRSSRFVKYVEDMKGKDEFARARKRGDYHVEREKK